MKKLFILIISLACALMLSSCNLADQLGEISEQIKNNIIDVAGQFIEKDTSKNSTSDTESMPDLPDVPVSSDDNSQSQSDKPDIPDVPTKPVLPEYVALQRVRNPLNKYVGFLVDNGEYKHNYSYGYARYLTSLENLTESDNLSYFKISDMDSVAVVDFDLLLAKPQPQGEGEISYRDICDRICAFANKYSAPSLFLYDTTRIEIGSDPDKKLSPQEYALLLNTIYDGNCKEIPGGVTFINPEIRLITGVMRDINLDYIKELMREVEALRTDAFLPVGGWSFEISSEGRTPEEVFFSEENLEALIEYRDKSYKDIEIILSGLGWDTEFTKKPSFVRADENYTSYEYQAMYIIRSFLLADSFGIDKLSISTLKDTDAMGEGIIKKNGTKKLAYDLLKYFKSTTNGFYFEDINKISSALVSTYKDENGRTMYAVWSTDGATQISFDNLPTGVIVGAYDTESKAYSSVDTATQNGTITVTATGMPTFVFFD